MHSISGERTVMRGNENEVSQMQLNYLQTEIIYENHTEISC